MPNFIYLWFNGDWMAIGNRYENLEWRYIINLDIIFILMITNMAEIHIVGILSVELNTKNICN
jgi:hypothetical protein